MSKHTLPNYTLLYLNKKLHEKHASLLLFLGFTAAHPCLFFFAQAIVQCTVSWGLQLFFKRLAGKHCQLVTD